MALQLTITTPEGLAWKGEALKLVVPALDGELGILPRHAPLVGQLGAGELRVTPAAGPEAQRYFIAGGFVHVLRDRVTVISTRAEAGRAIDAGKAEEELRLLLAEALPAGAGAEARSARIEKIRAAKARARVAGKERGKA